MVAEVRTLLPLSVCKPDDRVQSRAKLCSENVAYLAGKLAEGHELDPIVVFKEVLPDGRIRYWLASGFHRWHAHEQAGRSHIEAQIIEGGMRKAILFSVSCNDRHGLRRTSEDIQHTVRMLLTDAEWGKWTDRAIADQCKLHHSTVSRHRENWHREQKLLSQSDGKEKSSARTYMHRSGQTTTMNVAGIQATTAGRATGPVNGAVDASEPTPANLFVKFADEQEDRKRIEKQGSSAARKLWRFAYRLARLHVEVEGGDLDDTIKAWMDERLEWARLKEIDAARRKHA